MSGGQVNQGERAMTVLEQIAVNVSDAVQTIYSLKGVVESQSNVIQAKNQLIDELAKHVNDSVLASLGLRRNNPSASIPNNIPDANTVKPPIKVEKKEEPATKKKRASRKMVLANTPTKPAIKIQEKKKS